ncbi:hypothetical protein [Thermoactinomyces sp. DSM 45892]|uniref:hypothetical protein n=1 Tax=Thermoactinomyces sp. DSM 45892 TaxID=1882753 RepID=UPI00089907C9|nr:hypothetical protein [Thermoactinomyces sp. DSM 45892]SDY68986.1 hypothetical protein SAMN05444416_10783 [Thermoactinomyces sp. DSM 45892]
MTELEYHECLQRLVKGAEYLGRTDLTPKQREIADKLCDELTEKILRYQGMEWAIYERTKIKE